MTQIPDILCIGSVLWDMIGRTTTAMRVGNDVPGRITRLPGGVAMNIAMTLKRFGLTPAVLTAIGRDPEGDALLHACDRLGIDTRFVYRPQDLPSDRYMAIEGANGLVAAIADAHSLETAGAKILKPLEDGKLGTPATPYVGPIALDGNLTESLLREIAGNPAFARADLRVAPASPGKAKRLLPLFSRPNVTFYVNLEEAGLLCHTVFDNSCMAVEGLLAAGATRVIVTDGGSLASEGYGNRRISLTPPEVLVTRVTGAGDTFMAAHIAAETKGAPPHKALKQALEAAAAYVAGGAEA